MTSETYSTFLGDGGNRIKEAASRRLSGLARLKMDGGGSPKRCNNLDKRRKEEDEGMCFLLSAQHLSLTPPQGFTPLHLPLRQTNEEVGAPFIFLAPPLAPYFSCLIGRFYHPEGLNMCVCVFLSFCSYEKKFCVWSLFLCF